MAYLVGFSDPAAFSRAFKRWTGRARGKFATRRPLPRDGHFRLPTMGEVIWITADTVANQSASSHQTGTWSDGFSHPRGRDRYRCLKPVCRLRRKQNVVDANAVVLLPSARLIVPERVRTGLGVAGAESVGQTEISKVRMRARRRQEKRVLAQASGS